MSFAAFTETLESSIGALDAQVQVEEIISKIRNPSSAEAREALTELKELSRSHPTTVAIVAIAPLAKLLPQIDNDADSHVLSDVLEIFQHLLAVRNPPDEESFERLCRELVQRTDGARLFLDLLESKDVYVRLDVMQLLQKLLTGAPTLVHKTLLSNPQAFGTIIDTLSSSRQDFIRNECLALLLLLTESKQSEILTIICFQGGCEHIFQVLLQEANSSGSVAKSCLTAINNLAGHNACLKYMREAGCIRSMLSVLKSLSQVPDEGSDQAQTNVRVDLLLKAMGSFLSDSDENERVRNIKVFVQCGVVEGVCQAVTMQHFSLAAKMSCIALLTQASREPDVAIRLAKYIEEEQAPPLFLLTAVLLRVVTPSTLRSVVLDFIETVVPNSDALQSFLVSSLSPQSAAPQTFEDFLEQETEDRHNRTSLWNPTGRDILEIIDALLEQCSTEGAPSSSSAQKGHERFWFGATILASMVMNNADVASAAAVIPIDVPQDYATPPTQFLDRILEFFRVVAARVIKAGTAGAEDIGRNQSSSALRKRGYALDALSDSDFTEQTSLLAMLQLFIVWFSSNTIPFARLTNSPVLLPLLISLASLPELTTDLGRLLEGAACLLLGVALTAEGENQISHASIMSAIASRIGVETFCASIDFPTETLGFRKALRAYKGGSRAALKPDEFRWFGPGLAACIEDVKYQTRRKMVQLYISSTPPGDSRNLSSDIAEHYKDLIKTQDNDLQKFKNENETLRREVEELALRHLSVESSVLLQKAEATEKQRDALAIEVKQLKAELSSASSQLVCAKEELRITTSQLQRENKSLLMAYTQMEQAQNQTSGDQLSQDLLGNGDIFTKCARLEQDLSDSLALLQLVQQKVPNAKDYLDL